MKIVKVFFIFALVSMIAVSCKETKKEEVQDDAVEMTEESEDAEEVIEVVESEAVEEESTDDSGAAAAGAAAAGAAAASSSDGAEAEEVEVVEEAVIEEVVAAEVIIIEEKLADTPVIYPGCSGSVEEIRACNKESFVAYIKSNFNHDAAQEAGLKRGDYKIQITMHVNKAGRVFASRVIAPHKSLENEMLKVVNNTPKVTPATKAGQPVVVSLQFNVDFKVEQTQ